jgi:hypothetical protein
MKSQANRVFVRNVAGKLHMNIIEVFGKRLGATGCSFLVNLGHQLE